MNAIKQPTLTPAQTKALRAIFNNTIRYTVAGFSDKRAATSLEKLGLIRRERHESGLSHDQYWFMTDNGNALGKTLYPQEEELLKIAQRNISAIESFRAVGRDSADFHEVHISTLRRMLLDAYAAGQKSNQ